ncbi:MAG: hypothetical protein WB611_12185 [Stellaceae bacterium]
MFFAELTRYMRGSCAILVPIMRPPSSFLVLWLGCFVGSACYAQGNAASNQKPCSFLTKSEAESIVGASLVIRRNTDDECWYVESGFTKPGGPRNKQVYLDIWRTSTPQRDDVITTRANIADRQPAAVTRDLPGFADAALWSWMPGAGRLSAFKGGIIGVDVMIGGIDESPALQHAKVLAARALGGAGGTGYDYAKASAAQAAQARAAAQPQSLTSFQPTWMGQSKVVRGTVSRVDVDFSRFPQWLTIFFRESPDAAFVACSPYPDMLQDSFGDLAALVGKTLEVSGQVEPAMCRGGKGASIRLLESKQSRVQGGPPPGRIVAAGGGVPIRRRQGARIGLDICNAGQIDFDAFVARQGRASTTHLAPRDCAHVYEETGGGAYVGFAFSDGRGQWGGPRRIDLLPNTFGSYNAPTRVWSAGAGQTFPVNRGGRSLSMPMQLLFSPPVASCTTSEPYSAVAHLPLNATSAQRTAANLQDANMPAPQTTCSSFDYALNAVAYPDTREVSFEIKCAGCPLGQPPATTAAQRAGGQQALLKMSTISPLAVGILGQAVSQEQDQELKRSLEGQQELRRMNWGEMNQALAKVSPTGGGPPEMPQSLILRATVSRVDVSPPQASEHWVNVYFRESPGEQAFNVCTSDPAILVDVFGPDFRTRMIGQMLEVEGEYQRNYCKGTKGSIRITLAHQLRKVTGQ